jgi:uncharacterized protein
MEMGSIGVEGFGFVFNPQACEVCPGHCCCGESGHVWVNQLEMAEISSFLKINLVDFIEQYLYCYEGRFSCKEYAYKQGMACIFFQSGLMKCSIYEVRPSGCRSYPFWDYYKNNANQVAKECPGIILFQKCPDNSAK